MLDHSTGIGSPPDLLEIFSAIAAEPSVDVARLERAMEGFERLKAREAEAAFNVALARLQPRLPVIDENGVILGADGEPISTYATWADTIDAIRPVLARYGFSLSFRPGCSGAGRPTVTGVLRHRGGHKEEGTLELPPDETGGKNALQAVGSALSYGQRYVARMLLSLTSRGADDDAQSAFLSQAAADAIAEINGLGDAGAFAAWKRANLERLKSLPPSDLRFIVGHYTDRRRRVAMRESVA